MGGHSERVSVAREERRDPQDDGGGGRRHQAAGRLCGAGGHRDPEGGRDGGFPGQLCGAGGHRDPESVEPRTISGMSDTTFKALYTWFQLSTRIF